MWNPTKGLVKKHAHAVGGPPLDAIWILHNTWPRGRRRRAGLQGSEQILQREVKLDGRRCIRAKRGTHSWFHKGVWNRNSVRLSPAASESLRARQRCLLNLPEERCCTVTNPGTSGCSRDQYHKQEFHLRTNNPHTPSDLNNFFGIYLPTAEIKQSLLLIRVWMLLETCEVIDENVLYYTSPWWQKLHFTRVLRFKLAFEFLIREAVELQTDISGFKWQLFTQF